MYFYITLTILYIDVFILLSIVDQKQGSKSGQGSILGLKIILFRFICPAIFGDKKSAANLYLLYTRF